MSEWSTEESAANRVSGMENLHRETVIGNLIGSDRKRSKLIENDRKNEWI